ncbi:hypothetical protein C8Q75DRAFT_803319 [Abortiporus biennis]|nr:hypothetical protein C8Q75DRAFT_803319 [Abortiporus biennis]
MFSIPTLVSLFLAVPTLVLSSPCVTFDADFNLLAFGFDGKDWNAGTQDTWTTGSATDITTTGRPPFDGTNTTCYLAQFFNAVYIMNGDASNPSAVHIYDAAAKSWSTQAVTTGTFDPSSFDAILDHDTNVFYALSHGELFFLNMDDLKVANSTAMAWTDVEKSPYGADYQPVMALASNHIHFLNVPDTPAGDAQIFVIHFSFFQPAPQPYPLSDGSAIPATHGQTASFFQASGVQQEFAFIPDDGSATYVIDVLTNTTQKLAGPTTKDSKATYAASITALVELDSTGALSFLPYKQGDDSANTAATWTKLSKVAVPSSVSASSGTSATKSGVPTAVATNLAGGANATNSAASGKSTGGASQASGASSLGSHGTSAGMMLAGVLAFFAFLL